MKHDNGEASNERELDALLLDRLALRLNSLTDLLWRSIETQEQTYRNLARPLRDDVRETIRWIAELFVRSAARRAEIPEVAVARLRELGAERARNGTTLEALINAIRTGMRVVWNALVTEADAVESLDESVVTEIGHLTLYLAEFTTTVCETMRVGYLSIVSSASSLPSGTRGRSVTQSPLPKGAVDTVGPLNDTSPPYVLFVLVPISDTGSDLLREALAELSMSMGNLVEGAHFSRPIPHLASVASRVEPWRLEELRSLSDLLARRRQFVAIHSPPVELADDLKPYYHIARIRLDSAVKYYRTGPRVVPLASLAFDAVITTIPKERQVAFIKTLFGTGLSLPPARIAALVETVDAILHAGGSGSAPARELSLHRHGVSYRRRRIKALAGHDPAAPSSRLAFLVATRMLELGNDVLPPLGDKEWETP